MPVRVKVEDDPISIDGDDDDADKDNNAIEEDDEIVREMDVFLSPQLAPHLHLLQFPLQQYFVPSSQQRGQGSSKQLYSQFHEQQVPLAARFKPQHNMLELDQAIPTNLIEQMGQINLYQRSFASHTVPVTTHLALGKIVEDDMDEDAEDGKKTFSLHLAPIQHITQMRPTFSHIDEMDSAENADADAAAEEERQKQQQQQQSSERKPLMFQKKESERAAMARKNSYAYKKASEEGEEWISLKVKNGNDADNDFDDDEEEDMGDTSVAMLLQQLECPKDCRGHLVLDNVQRIGGRDHDIVQGTAVASSLAAATTKADNDSLVSYVRSLDYLPSAVATYDRAPVSATTANQSGNDDPEEALEHLINWKQSGLAEGIVLDLPTIAAHLTTVLRQGWPIPFKILKNTLPPSVKEQDLLTALTSCAVLVRGNYVLQSRLLSLPKSLAKARTFILLLLQSIGVIHRRRLDLVFGIGVENDNSNNSGRGAIIQDEFLTAETVFMLLKQVARKTSDGWVLKIQDDIAFLNRFPENANIYMTYWGRQMLPFQANLQRYAGVG